MWLSTLIWLPMGPQHAACSAGVPRSELSARPHRSLNTTTHHACHGRHVRVARVQRVVCRVPFTIHHPTSHPCKAVCGLD
jgi:hypothetical protein